MLQCLKKLEKFNKRLIYIASNSANHQRGNVTIVTYAETESVINGINVFFNRSIDRSGDFVVTYRLVLFGSTISLEFPFNQPHPLSPFLSFFVCFSPVLSGLLV